MMMQMKTSDLKKKTVKNKLI